MVLGGKQGAKGGGVRVGEREDVGVGPAKTRYAKQAANLNGPAQNEWPHLVLRSLVSSVPFPRARVAVSGCDSPTHTQLCTRQRAKGGVGRGEGKVRGGGREGEKEREREKKRHEERIDRTKTERVTGLWLPLTFPHPFLSLVSPWHTCTQRNYALLSHRNSRCARTSSVDPVQLDTSHSRRPTGDRARGRPKRTTPRGTSTVQASQAPARDRDVFHPDSSKMAALAAAARLSLLACLPSFGSPHRQTPAAATRVCGCTRTTGAHTRMHTRGTKTGAR